MGAIKMNVKELKEKLKDMPEDAIVIRISGDWWHRNDKEIKYVKQHKSLTGKGVDPQPYYCVLCDGEEKDCDPETIINVAVIG
jgi:hypothetical protein